MSEDSNTTTDELLKLTRENNHILRGMRRSQRWHTLFQLIYWLVAAGVVVVSYRYIQPYLETLMNAYASIQKTLGNIPKF